MPTRWSFLGSCAVLLAGCPEDSELPPPPIASAGPATAGDGSGGTGGSGGSGQADGTASSGDMPCVQDDDCDTDGACIGEVCVGTGQLRVTLRFSVDSDFDLHVLTPSGAEIFYSNPVADGGQLDVDSCIEPCGTGTHVENIFFAAAPACGAYTTWVVNFDGRGAGPFDLDVVGAANESFSGNLPTGGGAESTMYMFEVPCQ
ncbi:MAG: hypothetical protein KDK70_02730 [Myxococcales bacterium]|nr:hypothetical protein [Myxococcales bacterium]